MYKAKTRETDYIQQLANYFKKNLQKGYTSESLKWALISQGYSRTEIDRALNIANEQLGMQAPKMIEKPVIKVSIEPPMPKINQGKSFWQKIKDFCC